MSREDIIKLAREAGFKVDWQHADVAEIKSKRYEHFAALVAEHEREACAELALQGTDEPVQTKTLEILRKERERIAAAIRARGKQCG